MSYSKTHNLPADAFLPSLPSARPVQVELRRNSAASAARANAIDLNESRRAFKGAICAFSFELCAFVVVYGFWEILHFFR